MGENMDYAMTILSAFIALALVLGLAYFCIRWLSHRVTPQTSTRVIKIVDRVMIGQDKCLLVVKIPDKTMLVGMSGDSIVKLCDVDEEAVESHLSAIPPTADFSQVMNGAISKLGLGKHKKEDGSVE